MHKFASSGEKTHPFLERLERLSDMDGKETQKKTKMLASVLLGLLSWSSPNGAAITRQWPIIKDIMYYQII